MKTSSKTKMDFLVCSAFARTLIVGSRMGAFAAIGVLLIGTSVAEANITGWSSVNDDGDAIACNPTFDGVGTDAGDLTIQGTQSGGPGYVGIRFTTNTVGDPKITFNNQIENDTASPWASYVVIVTLDTNAALTGDAFTLSNAAVTSPEGWTAAITGAPRYVGSGPGAYGYEYSASIGFTGGAPVGNGDELDFSYKIIFAGATGYQAIQTMMPTSAVPEPGMSILALSGLLGLAATRIARRRRA